MEKLSVKKPFTILVAVIAVLVLGIVSVTRMTTDLLPNISLPYLMVVTTYPGASPERVVRSTAWKTSTPHPRKTTAWFSWNLPRERTWILLWSRSPALCRR